MFKQKLLIVLSMLCMVFHLNAQVTVQGFPQGNGKVKSVALYADPTIGNEDGTFTFDMIQNWTGEGKNKAAVVIQWNDDREQNAMVFGYKWDGEATSIDMMHAIAANDPRFYLLEMYADESLGISIGGFGWDLDEDGDVALMYQGKRQEQTSPGVFAIDDYLYDDYSAADEQDYWSSGWYQSYWSFWTKDSASDTFGYSQVGASNRKLTDGCWDGWNFSLNMSPRDWKKFVPAPSLIPADAKTEFVADGIYYRLKSFAQKTVEVVAPFETQEKSAQTYVVSSPMRYDGDIVVPETFMDEGVQYTVVGIADNAFQYSSVVNVTLPKSIKKIGKYAFESSNVNAIHLEDGVEEIGAYAFQDCFDLQGIHIPTSLKKIEPYTFFSNGLTELVIPDNVTEIGAYAFARLRECTSIKLSENLVKIDEGAFSACIRLTELTIPASVRSIGSQAFYCPRIAQISLSNITPLDIPEDVFYEGLFSSCYLYIPVGYLEEYKNAPGWNKFERITEVPIKVNEGDVFYVGKVYYKVTSCAKDKREVAVVHYPVIGEATANAIKAVNKVGYTGDVVVPATVDYQLFPYKVVAVADSAFLGASMTSIEMKHVEKLGEEVCGSCESLTRATLPENLKVLPARTFNRCEKLVSVSEMPQIEMVGDRAFFYCKELEWPAFGENLSKIEGYAFYNCSALNEIVYPAKVDTVAEYVFDYCGGLTKVTLGENVVSLGSYSFANCPNLSEINIPSKVTELPSHVFYKTALESVVVPEAVKALGNSAFGYCTKLKEITLHENLSFATSVFESCSSLAAVKLPESLRDIPNSMFSGCVKLKTVELSDSVATIGSNVFYRSGIESFVFPAGLTSIGRSCFDGCSLLDSVKINDKVTTLPVRLFAETNLKELVIPATVTQIESNLIFNAKNQDMKIWLCGMDPAKITSDRTFMLANKVYATLTVPYGTTQIYKDANSYWTKNTYEELTPALAGVKMMGVEPGDSTAVLKAVLMLDYAERVVPAAFEVVNNAAFLDAEGASLDVKVEYRKAGSDEEFVSAEAAFEGNEFTAMLEKLSILTEYEYRWAVLTGESPVYSETEVFKTTGQLPLEDYTEGFFVLNEDWMGHNNGSINFVTAQDEFYYNVFQKENPGNTLGATSQYGTIYGDKMFVVSKKAGVDAGNGGGVLMVTDAASMKQLASVDEIGGEEGRSFIGVSDTLGYVGTSKGIYRFNTVNYTVGDMIAGTDTEIGDMVRYQDHIFAAGRNKGVLVIDASSNELVNTIDLPGISTVFVTYAGGLYAASNGEGTSGFYQIDPYTFETEAFLVPDNLSVADSWSGWQTGKVTSSVTKNEIYYAISGWTVTGLYKYNFDTKTLTPDFVTFPEGQMLYGTVSTNPVTGEIITTTQQVGYGENSKYNWLHFINPDEEGIARTVAMREGFWFPSMEIYPDLETPEVNGLEEAIVLDFDQDEVFKEPLLDLVSDEDNYKVSIAAEIKNVKGADLMDVKLEKGNLVISPLENGDASFDLVVNSNGRYVTKNVAVTVNKKPVGIEDVDAAQNVLYHDGVLTVHASEDGLVQLFHISGQMVMAEKVVKGENVFNLSDLKQGVYVVKFNDAVLKIVR